MIYGTIGADIDLDDSGSVNFQRDMGLTNAVGPGVSVIWNPNLLLNFPAQLTDALTACPVGVTPRRVDVDHGSGERMTGDWREVAP